MLLRTFIVGTFLLFCVLKTVQSKAFLHNALISLASSASASSSSSIASASSGVPERLTNIVDYTRRSEKIKQLENEKQLIEDVNDDPNEKERNEATPNLLQKKINTIVAKIKLLTTFTENSSTENNNNTDTEITTTNYPKSDVKIDFGEFPLRINLDTENITNFNSSDMNGRIGQIGIYFTELFGSLIGLLYGAMAHITNTIQGSQSPETAI